MFLNILISLAKTVSYISKKTNRGAGSTWPGHIALGLNENIIENLLQDSPTQVVLVVGTNGKTTTARILTTILKENKLKVIQNTSGANLLNGIASSLLLSTNRHNKLTADFAVFEVDENNLPLVLNHVTPKIIIALDLFRDQLDRYGELDSIAKKWNRAFKQLPETTNLILNADDPLIAYLAKDVKTHVEYFGIDDKDLHPRGGENQQTTHTSGVKIQLDHAADSIYCPQCGSKLLYKKIFYSHLGIWKCPTCHIKRPSPQLSNAFYSLPGTYNKYNILAAVLTAQQLGISEKTIDVALHSVTPAFGRQEKLVYQGKNVMLFLSKNPTSFNESLKTIADLGAKNLLIVLNDRIPDGRDVSWIWDVDFESNLKKYQHVVVSGDRTYDMALRLQYANEEFQISNFKFQIIEDLDEAIQTALKLTNQDNTLYILPTYSAMLEVRKILTGRKIL